MAYFQYLLAFLLSSCLFQSMVNADVVCPFSPSCQCVGTDPASKTYRSAVCEPKLPIIPPFNAQENEYTITDQLTVRYNVYQIRPLAFSAFKSIDTLILEQSLTPAKVSAKWDSMAFKNVQIKNLQVYGVAGVIPAPNPLRDLARRGLETLSVNECRENVNLDRDGFLGFSNLSLLQIANTPISKIDPSAFAGLENTLIELALIKTSLSVAPIDAVIGLGKLQRLILAENAISTIDSKISQLLDRPNFQRLDISGNGPMICDQTTHWMAKYALCNPTRLQIDNVRCANDEKLLIDYLRQAVPNKC